MQSILEDGCQCLGIKVSLNHIECRRVTKISVHNCSSHDNTNFGKRSVGVSFKVLQTDFHSCAEMVFL